MGIKVSGACRTCGKIHTTEASGNRVTWRGPCPEKGCTGVVMARRVTGAPTGEKPAESTTEPEKTTFTPASRAPKRRVVKVDAYGKPAAKPKRSAESGSTPDDQRPEAPGEHTGEQPGAGTDRQPEARTEAEPRIVREKDSGKRRRFSVRFNSPYEHIGY